MDYPTAPIKLTARDLILRLHSWFLSHRFQLRKWWVILILSFDILLTVYVATSLLFLATQSSRLNRGLLNSARALSPPSVLVTEQPTDLTVPVTVVVPQSNGQADFIARVDNSNQNWAAVINYHFGLTTGQLTADWTGTEPKTATILPGQTAYFSMLGAAVAVAASATGEFTIDQLTWRRLSDHSQLANIAFEVSETVYEPNVTVPNSSTQLARVTAQVTNRSLYGFWTINVPVVLLVGDKPVAMKQVTLRNMRPGETKSIEAQWFGDQPVQATADIRPQVDIFDDQNYMN